ncbi:MAG: hypothetical protein WBP81_32435, partial [Solirubrobacteraceae bacterium]
MANVGGIAAKLRERARSRAAARRRDSDTRAPARTTSAMTGGLGVACCGELKERVLKVTDETEITAVTETTRLPEASAPAAAQRLAETARLRRDGPVRPSEPAGVAARVHEPSWQRQPSQRSSK